MQEGKFIFISHAEEDEEIALKIADYLEKEGYKTWYYLRDSLAGLSYLGQFVDAIRQSSAIILIISPNSLKSFEVDKEVAYAHKMEKTFIPVLYGIGNEEINQQKPMWGFFLGNFASIKIPKTGIETILPRIVMGIKALGIKSIDEEGLNRKENIQVEKKAESSNLEAQK